MTSSTLTVLADPIIFLLFSAWHPASSFVYRPIIRSSSFRDYFFNQKHLTPRHFNSRCCYEGHFLIQCH